MRARDDGKQRALGEGTVTDLTALRRTHSTRLARGERREVVVVHVALLLVERDRVEHLLHAGHAEREDRQDLRLAPLEEAGAVRGRDDADLGAQRADVGGTAPVDAHTLVDDVAARHFLLQGAERPLHRGRLFGVAARRVDRAGQRDQRLRFDLTEARVALRLVDDLHRLGGARLGVVLHGFEDLGRVVERREVLDRLDRAVRLLEVLAQTGLQIDRGGDPALRLFEAVGDRLFGDLRCTLLVELPRVLGATGFDHHDRDVAVVELAAGDDDLERRFVALLVGGVGDPGALVVREAHGTDRTVERDAGHGERGRRAVDRRDVVRVLEVDTEHGGDDLDLVAEVLRERRAQRPVGQAGGEDRVLTGPAFAAEERAGDLAGCVRALFDVDREREEVDAFARLRRADRGQHGRVADAHGDRAVGQVGEAAGFERHLESGGVDGTADADDGIDRRIAHGREPLCVRCKERNRFPVVSVLAGLLPPGARD